VQLAHRAEETRIELLTLALDAVQGSQVAQPLRALLSRAQVSDLSYASNTFGPTLTS